MLRAFFYLYGMRYKIPIEIIELELENYHPVVSTVFADGTRGKWVVDTGASKSVFDIQLAQHIAYSEGDKEELHSAGISEEPIQSTLGVLKTVLFGKLQVENMKVALLDLSHINQLYSRATDLKICGLLGSDFLVKHKAVLDYKRSKLVLLK